MENINIKPDVTINPTGISLKLISNEDVIYNEDITWSEILMKDINNNIDEDGSLRVDNDYDYPNYLISLIDGLHNAADEIEENVRLRKVKILNNLVNNMMQSDIEVSFTKYMKGDYE